MKKFNVTGLCVPEKHYMVDTEDKLHQIIKLIDDEQYFTINRARQYGKTTILFLLERALILSSKYICISLSFEGVGGTMFESDENFCREFLIQVSEALRLNNYDFANEWIDDSVSEFTQLGRHISRLCADKKIILMIDEVDATSKNSVFLRFLAMLRNLYLQRPRGKVNTFHSVILAGVNDIKNIKLKLITAGLHKLESQEGNYNSPWNIAANFDVEMFFTAPEIATMLADYENDHRTGMDITAVSEEIFNFTGGYPFWVSRICKCIDEELQPKQWNIQVVHEAVKKVTTEKNTLIDDLAKNLNNYKEIYNMMFSLLIVGEPIPFTTMNPNIELCYMHGYILRNKMGYTAISNKIYEILLADYFASVETNSGLVERMVCNGLYNEIVTGGVFNMALCLSKFAEYFREIFSEKDMPFLEREGRLIFLSYLKPLLNGRGFFHIESQNTDMRRMDVVVDYAQEQFIIELKLWKGERAQVRAYEQLLNYMNARHLDKGYLLTFDFRKEGNREPKAEWVQVGDKEIFDVIV